MLTFLAVLAGDEPRRELPRCRKDLYREYVERLFTTWEAYRQFENRLAIGRFHGEQAKTVVIWGLYQIAILLQNGYYSDNPERLPTRNNVKLALDDNLAQTWGVVSLDAETLPSEILEFWMQAGLLDTYAQRDSRQAEHEWMSFRHQTFQEYGAARALSRKYAHDLSGLWMTLSPYLFRTGWSEVAPLALACLADNGKDATPFVKLLLADQTDDEDKQRSLFLAASALADGAIVDEKTKRSILETLDRFIWQLENDESEWKSGKHTRDDAFRAMISIGWSDPKAVLPFLANLATVADRPELRVRAAEALGKIGLKEEAHPLLKNAAADWGIPRDWQIVAAWALGRLGYVEEAASILRKLAQYPYLQRASGYLYGSTAKWIVEILIELGQKEIVTDVWSRIASDPRNGAEYCLEAIEALAEVDQEGNEDDG